MRKPPKEIYSGGPTGGWFSGPCGKSVRYVRADLFDELTVRAMNAEGQLRVAQKEIERWERYSLQLRGLLK